MTPTAYLGPQTYGQAVAINSLLYDTPRYGQRRHPTVPPSPSRKQHPNIRKTKDNRDPYRNQYLQMPGHRTGTSQSAADKTSNNYDEYFRQPDYGREKSVDYEKSHREPDNGGYHAEENSNIPNRKATSREQPGLQQHQRRGNPPDRSPTYRQIGNTFNSAPEPGSRTSLHAVLDFDDDFENYDDEEGDGDVESVTAAHQGKSNPQVTPIEGPIFIKNGSVPVVPLYSYPVINNGTLVQIPIFRHLSVARLYGKTHYNVGHRSNRLNLYCSRGGVAMKYYATSTFYFLIIRICEEITSSQVQVEE
ncbi:hypothetical protein RUM43_014756 [Polyplax serrata]|uniref:Uncharacterized protein n=1 Tax=Polyplax serrata TaxID=468196 RepID=A0AAN8P3P2_POLSC